jgi:hypothetical protein
VNSFFPPDLMMAARSIKRTLQVARIAPSKVCEGRGLWLLPNTALDVGDFVGLYTGWVYDDETKMAN